MAAGRAPSGQQWKPDAILDRALDDTWNELQDRGTGVEVEDVTRAPRQSNRRPTRGQSRVDDLDEERTTRRAPARRPSQDQEPDLYDTLADPDDETNEVDAPRRSRRAVAEPDDDDDDEDTEDVDELDDDDEDEDEDDEEGLDDADAEVDDEPVARSRRAQEDDDEDEDDEPVARRRGGKSRQDDSRKSGFSKKVDREIDRRVQAVVKQTIAENDRLRTEQENRTKMDTDNVQFLTKFLGTNVELQRLQGIATDVTKPQRDRDNASKWLNTYQQNRGFFENYKSGAWAVVRHEQAKEDQAVLQQVAQLRALDPKIVAKGNRAETLLHSYVTGMAVATRKVQQDMKKKDDTITRLRAQLAQDGPRRLGSRRRSSTAASASGRRVNGRVAQPDRTRGALSYQRGISPDSQVAFPTDEILRDIRNGDRTLADVLGAPARRR